MIVTFCGHSQISDPEKVQKDLEAAVHSVLSRGATRFYLGGYGDFDQLAAKVLYRLKRGHDEIDSVLVLPYLDKKVDLTLVGLIYVGLVYFAVPIIVAVVTILLVYQFVRD